jgi:isoleucyl-tRNA synthetase
MSAFKPISSKVSFPNLEEDVLGIWAERDTFKRSVDERSDESRYVFYDGPPFATGLPHYGHLVASTLKDIMPRYWTMRGHRVERRFGWDTHGLPIEMEMEKTLGLSGPSSIKEFGVGKFNEACRSNVLRYTEEWRRVITRLGRWVDFDNDYKTMDASFMETVWWVFSQLWEQGLIYKDFRVMPFSWRLSTSLSNFEANLDYRDVQDPAITVALPLVARPEVSLLIWTTTPWTLPSNLAVAVGPDLDYVEASKADETARYIVAAELAEKVLGKGHVVHAALKGAELVGQSYQALFPYFAEKGAVPLGEGGAFYVIAADHVTTGDGTGLVHMAPDFGEEDFTACKAVGIEVVQSVDHEGRLTAAIGEFAGRNVKEADSDLIRWIKDAGKLFARTTIQHSYPFCWRSGTPLIYKAVPALFVKVTALRDRMKAHNEAIHWVPSAVGQKRFGNWLADARDWNISRNRFWGTPIPVWRCEACGHDTCIGSIADLEARTGTTVDDLHSHKIDHLSFACDACGGDSRRISDVFDCWFESGAMPYAQDHYPFEHKAEFEAKFPAQFIAEGLDQTRGWFYTLLVLSTALFDKPPFKNVIVNGMVLAEDGSKMSKSKRNYPPPGDVLNAYGADALRAYLINSPIVRAEPLRFAEDGVREVVRTVLLPLRNAWSFFVQYANIDGWHPATGLKGVVTPASADRPELDRWILSVLQSLVRDVNREMEGYFLYRVVPPIVGFIDHLTNWYIRRSRRRFWRSADDVQGAADKAAAYATLYEVLVTFGKVMAPVLPFVTESLYQNLVVEPGVAAEGLDSVHLCRYPEPDEALIDTDLEAGVAVIRQVVTMSRALREQHKIKTRQPLKELVVVHHDARVLEAIRTHGHRVAAELNVKHVTALEHDDDLATLTFKANFKLLGRRFGKQMKACAAAVGALTMDEWHVLRDGGSVDVLGQPITADDVIVNRTPKGDVVILTEGSLTVALETDLDEALLREGLAREITSRLQRLRKERGFAVTDRIRVALVAHTEALIDALETWGEHIAGEILADELMIETDGAVGEALKIEGEVLGVAVFEPVNGPEGLSVFEPIG